MEPTAAVTAGVEAVEADLEKALTKFRGLGEHIERVLDEKIRSLVDLRQELASVPDDYTLSKDQVSIVRETVASCRETVQRLAGEHRDVHASVSRVGKAIDRHLVADYVAVAPRAAQFVSETNRRLADRAIVQHLYRQGLDSAAEALANEADITDEVCRGEPFAALQRVASALAAGDVSLALEWAERHADELTTSPLSFTLHRLRFLQIAKAEGACAAVRYARRHFPPHAARHERELQRAMCALAWLVEGGAGGTVPACYAALHDTEALCAAAADMFVREACTLLRLAPLSPLAAAVLAGGRVLPALLDIRTNIIACTLLRLAPLSPLAAAVLAGGRVLPALLDIRTKITHPHVAAAWAAKDELPLEVELGEDGGGHHSVFACPILRQQASEANPPMRLLCGHVISRDALTKLVQGVKLKCPYCPMEQSQSEARLIYFS